MTPIFIKIFIVLLPIVLHYIEALHDNEVIKSSNPRDFQHNRNWHVYDSVEWIVVYVALALFVGNWIVFFYGLSTRAIMLQVVLNKLRYLPAHYLGNYGMDGWCKRWFGSWWTLILKIIVHVALVVVITQINIEP